MTAVADPPPVTAGPDRVYRVAGSRVTLDTLVAAYFGGATAEAIADQYPTLALADIHSALGHYLRHRAAFDQYLARRRAEADAVRRENEARFPPDGLRARLLARRPG